MTKRNATDCLPTSRHRSSSCENSESPTGRWTRKPIPTPPRRFHGIPRTRPTQSSWPFVTIVSISYHVCVVVVHRLKFNRSSGRILSHTFCSSFLLSFSNRVIYLALLFIRYNSFRWILVRRHYFRPARPLAGIRRKDQGLFRGTHPRRGGNPLHH